MSFVACRFRFLMNSDIALVTNNYDRFRIRSCPIKIIDYVIGGNAHGIFDCSVQMTIVDAAMHRPSVDYSFNARNRNATEHVPSHPPAIDRESQFFGRGCIQTTAAATSIKSTENVVRNYFD